MARTVINEGVVEIGEPVSAINVTSLVDVMFCLLIMFMVATPLMTPDGAEVALPAARGEEITEEQFLYTVISIDRKGHVFLGTLPLSQDREKMKQELANNAKIKEDGRAFLQADEDVDYDIVIDILAAMKEAEVGEIGFVTDPNLRRIEEAKNAK
jgi:biopolymer transport protein ExbD